MIRQGAREAPFLLRDIAARDAMLRCVEADAALTA
jgi:hypothetical protein